MIQAIWEVLKDLWRFFHSSLLVTAKETQFKEATYETASMPVVESSFNQSKQSLAGVIIPSEKGGQSVGRAAYVQVDTTECLALPNVQFDTKVESLFYGDKVAVNRIGGKFAEVITEKGNRGWIKVDELADDVNQVFSNFKSGNVYNQSNPETVKLRRLIQDGCFGQRLNLPLHSTEYVLYVLKRRGTSVVWPPMRPREPGTWQSILRGARGVSMSIEPRTGAIMEYGGDTGIPGFMAYVEAVHPDHSITIQSVGRVDVGDYRVEEFTQDVWKEWRPVFITFS